MNSNFSFLFSKIALLVAITMLPSCSKDSNDSGGAPGAPTKGCIQGVVIDGQTGNRIQFPAFNDDNGIFALVRNKLISGKPLTTKPDDVLQKQGEYVLCDIPLDESFPLFMWLEGYEVFESSVTVRSTVASKSSGAAYDIVRNAPTELANLLAFPKGTNVKDLSFFVTQKGAPVAGAQVILKPFGGNYISWGSSFLGASSLRSKPLNGVTDAAGNAVFAAADLVLGGQYTWVVLPPDGGATSTGAQSSGVFTLGLRDAGDNTDPYSLYADLSHTEPSLVELSRSTDSNDPIPTGALVVYYNRAIEIAPGTEDSITATLSGNVTAELVDNVDGNKASEQVKVTIDGNKLLLEPIWKTNPNADTTKELNLAITYTGLTLRPNTSPEQLNTVTLSSAQVTFYQ